MRESQFGQQSDNRRIDALELVGIGVGRRRFVGAADGAVLNSESSAVGLDADALLVHVGKPPLLKLADDWMLLQILYRIITHRSFVAQDIVLRYRMDEIKLFEM